jgi:hypothetical protein
MLVVMLALPALAGMKLVVALLAPPAIVTVEGEILPTPVAGAMAVLVTVTLTPAPPATACWLTIFPDPST